MSEVRCQTSDVRCKLPVPVNCWISNVEYRISNVEYWMLNVNCRKSNVKCHKLKVKRIQDPGSKLIMSKVKSQNKKCEINNVKMLAIRHSVDRALPALSALLDLQFLQLSQLFQLSQFCQFFHSSDALSSPSSSNFEIENWKSLWKNERTNRVGRAGKARRAGKIGDPRELRELEEPKASEERETYKVQEWTAFQAWTLTLVASRSQQSALA